jgi:hypothetical protein
MLAVKKFLLQCRKEMIEIDILRDKQNYLRASLLPKAVQPKEMSVQTSGPGDMMADRMAEVADLDRQIEDMIRSLVSNHAIALNVIKRISYPAHRQVLELYYLNPETLSWGDVATRMHYSERQIYNLHGEALLEAQRIFESFH